MRGQECENTLGPEPVPGPRTGGRSRHGLSRSCAAGYRAAGPQDVAATWDKQDDRCASREVQNVNRPPLSFSHSSSALSSKSRAAHRLARSGAAQLGALALRLRRLTRFQMGLPRWERRPQRRCRTTRNRGLRSRLLHLPCSPAHSETSASATRSSSAPTNGFVSTMRAAEQRTERRVHPQRRQSPFPHRKRGLAWFRWVRATRWGRGSDPSRRIRPTRVWGLPPA